MYGTRRLLGRLAVVMVITALASGLLAAPSTAEVSKSAGSAQDEEISDHTCFGRPGTPFRSSSSNLVAVTGKNTCDVLANLYIARALPGDRWTIIINSALTLSPGQTGTTGVNCWGRHNWRGYFEYSGQGGEWLAGPVITFNCS